MIHLDEEIASKTGRHSKVVYLQYQISATNKQIDADNLMVQALQQAVKLAVLLALTASTLGINMKGPEQAMIAAGNKRLN